MRLTCSCGALNASCRRCSGRGFWTDEPLREVVVVATIAAAPPVGTQSMPPGWVQCAECEARLKGGPGRLAKHLRQAHAMSSEAAAAAAGTSMLPAVEPPRELTTCEVCGSLVRNLEKHRRKFRPFTSNIHGVAAAPQASGLSKIARTAKRQAVPERIESAFLRIVDDATTDVSDRCAARTRAGAQCTRPVVIPVGRGGLCMQHFNAR